MSSGRGRGYTGRHHLRDPRPGDEHGSPRASIEPVPELIKPDIEKIKPKEDMEKELEEKALKDVKNDGYHANCEDDKTLQELLGVDEQYTPLLTLLEQFSPGEDGIQFNRKLRHFETTVTSMCPDEARLHQAFSTFRAAALLSPVTARKLAAVGASFTRQQRQLLLRGALLNVVMQGTFSKLDVLERANPSYLINAANLMGDYFAEARLCNGNKVHILASPLLQYMRALLASNDIRAHRSLATQLMQNGRELLSVLAQELDELSISIRLRLLTPPPVSIIWLLLSADLCLNKFLPLPNMLQQFYAAHLELTTDENYSEVSYGSWKKSPEKDDSNDSEKISQNVSQISLNHDDDAKPKLRPILGAGAGLLRQEQALTVSQDFDNWKPKSLSKRYDLNSWRQAEEEKKEEEPVFNPTVLPPNLQQNYPTTVPDYPITVPDYPITVPDYPPPNVRYNNFPQENFPNYLQQGDGTYIQNQYPTPTNTNFSSQGDFAQFPPDIAFQNQNERTKYPPGQETTGQFQNDSKFTTPTEKTQFTDTFTPTERPERINNEIQKNSNRRPVENWRKEKPDAKGDSNHNKPKNWSIQRSKDNLNEEEDKPKEEKFRRNSRDITRDRPGNRLNRRNSTENQDGESGKTPPRRHVTEVPRNQKYWDHDDRCDKDYNS